MSALGGFTTFAAEQGYAYRALVGPTIMAKTPQAAVVIALMLATIQASAVEHPGLAPQDVACVSCHADKAKGMSVHSAMELPCGVCHVTSRREDLMMVSLAAPRQQICSGCHLQATGANWHVPALVKGECVDCHDPHSSRRRMLLRAHAARPRHTPLK